MDADREQEFPLSQTLQEVFQQGASQALELREKQHTLNTLQAALLEIEKSSETVSSNIKLKERILSGLFCDIEQIQSNIVSLDTRTQMILTENLKLRNSIEEQLETSRSLLVGYSLFRTKMENYKMAVSLVESQAAIYKELMEKEEEVAKLKEKLEELKEDLQKPEGNAVCQAQKEIDSLKEKIRNTGQIVRERRTNLETEQKTQSQLRKEIDIQNRRCEAIIKRLHCQLNKAQCSHRQLCSDISHMEKEVEDLKSQLEGTHAT